MDTEPSPPLSLDELIEHLREITGPAAEDAPRDTEDLLRTRERVEQERERLSAVWQAAPTYEKLEFWAPAFIALALDDDAQRVLTTIIDSGELGPEELAGRLLQRAALYPAAMEDAVRADIEAAIAAMSGSPAILLRAAELLYNLAEYARSAELAGRAAAMTPSSNSEALEQQMWALLELEDADARERLTAVMDRLLQLKNRDIETITDVAHVRDVIGDRDGAVAALEWGEAVAGDDPDQLSALAAAYVDMGEEQRGVRLYARALERRPDDTDMLRYSALARRQMGDTEAALADLDRALAVDPGNVSARYSRADVRIDAGDLTGAVEDASAALEVEPDSFIALRQRAQAYVLQNQGEAALADYDHMLAVNPNFMPAYLGRSAVLSLMGRAEDAGRALDEGIERLPDSGLLLTTRAMFRAEQQDLAGAVADWTRVIELDPSLADAYVNRGMLLLDLNESLRALADFDRALEQDPDKLPALHGRVVALLQTQRHEAAAATLDRVLQIEPDDTHMLLLRAHLSLEHEDEIGAVADYTRVLELDPDNVPAIAGLGNIRMLRGEYAGALRDYERAFRLDPQSGALLYNLAAAEARLGNCAQAVELLRRAAARDPRLIGEIDQDPSFEDCRAFPAFARLRKELAHPRPKPAAPATPRRQGRPPRGRR